MYLENSPFSFMEFIDNKSSINPSVRSTVLGTEWKARDDPNMIRHAVKLVQYGHDRFHACRDIITRINNVRAKTGVSKPGIGIRRLNFVLHDEISGFDSEAGMDGCGTICVNLMTRAGWLDQRGDLWYVPTLLIIYHELGHYLQYISNPAEYERAAQHEAQGGQHLLDAMNLPDNEYPLCAEIGMGRRELYTDMHELNHPSFANKKINHSVRIPRDKNFKAAEEPADVRKKREFAEQKALADKGLGRPVGKLVNTFNPFAPKK